MIRSDKEPGLVNSRDWRLAQGRAGRASRMAIKMHVLTCVPAMIVAFIACVTGVPGIAISALTMGAGWTTWRWITKPMFERRLDEIYAEFSGESGFVGWPPGFQRHYNGSGEPCDMWIGPCCCGATHTAAERGA